MTTYRKKKQTDTSTGAGTPRTGPLPTMKPPPRVNRHMASYVTSVLEGREPRTAASNCLSLIR